MGQGQGRQNAGIGAANCAPVGTVVEAGETAVAGRPDGLVDGIVLFAEMWTFRRWQAVDWGLR
ncbi:MAG: hypothetical protein AAFX92_12310 [Pseudomonadota bacterium]